MSTFTRKQELRAQFDTKISRVYMSNDAVTIQTSDNDEVILSFDKAEDLKNMLDMLLDCAVRLEFTDRYGSASFYQHMKPEVTVDMVRAWKQGIVEKDSLDVSLTD